MKKALLFLIAAAACLGQDQDEANQTKFYRFDFVFKENEGGKLSGQRNYTATGNRFSAIQLRSGEKIPVANLKSGESTYLDVGTNIDCRILQEKPEELQLYVAADTSTADSRVPPIVSQTKWSSNLLVPLKKPVIIFTSDGTGRNIQTQLELTVTPLQ